MTDSTTHFCEAEKMWRCFLQEIVTFCRLLYYTLNWNNSWTQVCQTVRQVVISFIAVLTLVSTAGGTSNIVSLASFIVLRKWCLSFAINLELVWHLLHRISKLYLLIGPSSRAWHYCQSQRNAIICSRHQYLINLEAKYS